jgi:hypothetical protein
VFTRKSEGLPLYVRYVIEELREGKWSLQEEHKLPEGLTAYYDKVLDRLQTSDVGSILTPLFCVLALAKEPLPETTPSSAGIPSATTPTGTNCSARRSAMAA